MLWNLLEASTSAPGRGAAGGERGNASEAEASEAPEARKQVAWQRLLTHAKQRELVFTTSRPPAPKSKPGAGKEEEEEQDDHVALDALALKTNHASLRCVVFFPIFGCLDSEITQAAGYTRCVLTETSRPCPLLPAAQEPRGGRGAQQGRRRGAGGGAAGARPCAGAGPARLRSPRHMTPVNSIHEGSKCVRLRGGAGNICQALRWGWATNPPGRSRSHTGNA